MYTLHYAPDNASLIVRLMLEELGLPYRTSLVDRSRQAQDSAAYRAVNPAGLIPALVTPVGPVFETGAILLWLGDRHSALVPAIEAPGRAAFLSWLFFTSNTLHAALRQLFYSEKYAGSNAAIADFSALTRRRVAEHFELIDRMVAADKPDWLRPGSVSALGYYLSACLRWTQLYPTASAGWFDTARVPALMAIAADLQARPAALAAARAEGLGPTIFTAPTYATPPEGSAT
ncbi:MAG: glutathione S-transferase [Rhodobacteraceae bacterium]|nr:glutathione S-transferase [Paracoccaceae bacterium]